MDSGNGSTVCARSITLIYDSVFFAEKNTEI